MLSKEVPDKPLECYKSFSEFNQRMKSLQLVGWQFSVNDTVAHLKFYDNEHSVPKYEIFVDEQLVYTLRVLLWNINSHHEIYSLYHDH